jgi:hypothetical protein
MLRIIRPFAHCRNTCHSLIADAAISILDYNLLQNTRAPRASPSFFSPGVGPFPPTSGQLKQKAEAFLRPFSFSLALMYNPLEKGKSAVPEGL